jgi:hypothetical protein
MVSLAHTKIGVVLCDDLLVFKKVCIGDILSAVYCPGRVILLECQRIVVLCMIVSGAGRRDGAARHGIWRDVAISRF